MKALLATFAAATTVIQQRPCSGFSLPAVPPWPSALLSSASLTPKCAINAASKWLEVQDVTDPKLSAAELLAVAMGHRGAREMSQAIPLSAPCVLSLEQAKHFEVLCRRRAQHEPVQYLVGEWDWHNIDLLVRSPILIPRPETEELVELILEWLDAQGCKEDAQNKELRFLDVGCGSGAIGLTLLKALPGSSCVACDISPVAVALSIENSQRLGVESRYLCIESSIGTLGPPQVGAEFDFIVSNPPYIPTVDMADLQRDVLLYEDRGALWGGADGLDVVREIVEAAPSLLRWSEGSDATAAGGRTARSIWLELDSSHPPLLESWHKEGTLGHHLSTTASVEGLVWQADLSGRPRFVQMQVGQKDAINV
jgi:release factor glutamine methyltransferase